MQQQAKVTNMQNLKIYIPHIYKECVLLYLHGSTFSLSFPQTIAHTSDKVTQSLEQHFLWSELTVLSRFLLALSCNNPRNGKEIGKLLSYKDICTYNGIHRKRGSLEQK